MKMTGKILVSAAALIVLAAPNSLTAQPLSEALSSQSSVAVTSGAAPSMPTVLAGADDMTLERVRAKQDGIAANADAALVQLGDYLPQGAKRVLEDNCRAAHSIFDEKVLDALGESTSKMVDAAQRAKERAEQARKESIGKTIADASYKVASPGGNLCAGWVSMVCQVAGYGLPGGNADDMYYKYCVSTDRDQVRAGMIIAVPSHDLSHMGGLYGHVGIIVQKEDGSFRVRDNIGYICETPLDAWIETYNNISEVKWGWIIA